MASVATEREPAPNQAQREPYPEANGGKFAGNSHAEVNPMGRSPRSHARIRIWQWQGPAVLALSSGYLRQLLMASKSADPVEQKGTVSGWRLPPLRLVRSGAFGRFYGIPCTDLPERWLAQIQLHSIRHLAARSPLPCHHLDGPSQELRTKTGRNPAGI